MKFVSIAFFILIAAIAFPYVIWYADNPDTFQYLAIAQKYSIGDWSHAVNGYWSPLISWLLILPLLIIKNEIIAFKILQLIIAIFSLWQWNKLIEKIPFSLSLKKLLSFAAIPFLINYSLLNCTPDLLFLGLSLLLLNLVVTGDININTHVAVKTGIVGGLMFLTKAFSFFFFPVVVVAAGLIFSKSFPEDKFNFRNHGILFSIFILMISIWIITLSSHYNEFTISKAASFNLSRDVAPLPGRSEELPVLSSGLNKPPANSISAWESPGEYVSKEIVSPFNSTVEYFNIVKRNLKTIYYFDFQHQVGVFFLLLLVLFISRKGFSVFLREKWLAVSLIFIFILYGGYSLILVHTRYVWINSLLMMMLSVYFLQEMLEKKSLRLVREVSIAFIVLLSLKRPVKEILFTSDKNLPAMWLVKGVLHPFETMWVFYRPDVSNQLLTEDIEEKNILHGNVASLKSENMERDSYTSSLRISRETNSVYFGQLDDKSTFDQQKEELNKMNIDFLITWNNNTWGNESPVYYNLESRMRIYKIR